MQWTRPVAHRMFGNPGSVGLAYDHEQDEIVRFEPVAEYAVVTDALEIEFRRVPFDAQAVVRAVEAGGRPHPEQYARGWRG
jgi:diadenosine tetraphosphatase ApaH/serine/threonine PP2A family protein phosphatase